MSSLQWSWPALAFAAALSASPGAARADVAPSPLEGCERRPVGATCYVNGQERGVCARRPGGDGFTCLLVTDPKDAPPPPTTPDPPTELPPEPPSSGWDSDPDAPRASRFSCAAFSPGDGSRGAATAVAIIALLAGASGRRKRRAAAAP